MNQPPNDPKAGNGAKRPPDEGGKQNPLLAIVLAPIRAVGWFVGWDSEGGVKGVLGSFKTIIYAIVIAMVVRTFFYEPFNIPSGSLIPTLLIGDLPHALGRDDRDAVGHPRHGLDHFGGHREAELGREPRGAHHPQGVGAEGVLRGAGGARVPGGDVAHERPST